MAVFALFMSTSTMLWIHISVMCSITKPMKWERANPITSS